MLKETEELIILATNMAKQLEGEIHGFIEPLNHVTRLVSKIREDACRRKTGEEVGRMMENFVNIIGGRDQNKAFVEYIIRGTHRTNNQALIRLFLDVLKEEAKLADSGRYDARNEAAVVIAKRIEPIIADYYLPLI